jgi:hypothetical protein
MSTIQEDIDALEGTLRALEACQSALWQARQELHDLDENQIIQTAITQFVEQGHGIDDLYQNYRLWRENVAKYNFYRSIDVQIERDKDRVCERLKELRATHARLSESNDRLVEAINRAVDFFERHVLPRCKNVGAKRAVGEYRSYADPQFQEVTEIGRRVSELAQNVEQMGGARPETDKALKAGRWTEERIRQILNEARGG